MRKNILTCFFIGIIFLAWNARSLAESKKQFSDIVAFGDSLTDTGNACQDGKLMHLMCLLHTAGKFSDGKVWIEYLAENLNIPILPSSKGGNNFAFAGATSDWGKKKTPGLGAQVEAYLERGRPSLEPTILYVLWIGGNDLKNKFMTLSFMRDMEKVYYEDLLSNVEKNLRLLAKKGGKIFLVPNIPPVNRTPIAASILSSIAQIFSCLSWILSPKENKEQRYENKFALKSSLNLGFEAAIGYYNWRLGQVLETLENELDIKIYKPDLFHHLRKTVRQTEFQNEGESRLFYDFFHPSTLAHKLIADEVLRVLQNGN